MIASAVNKEINNCENHADDIHNARWKKRNVFAKITAGPKSNVGNSKNSIWLF